MEGTREDVLASLPFGQHVAAVHAHIVEGAYLPVLAEAHENLLIEDVGGEVVARLREIDGVADELPGLEPDLLLFALVDFRVPVVVAR